jgi:Mn2+/Fe2+ NRAMP family transporter
VFHRWLALIFIVAFLSLGTQVQLLYGTDGLVALANRASTIPEHTSWLAVPSWLRITSTDVALRGGVVVGVASALLALFGVVPRVCLAVATVD